MRTPSLIFTLIKKAQPFQKAYKKNGAQIRLVGGCVRDAILGNLAQDIDLATPLPPEHGMSLLKKEGITCIPTGIKHGTFTAILDQQPFEITTLRQDLLTDGRHAQVAFSNDWQVDAARRDLTINALYADFNGVIYDYFDGIGDLNQGIIRFIGQARARIEEDYLRLLRLFRFHAWYGKQPLDPATLKVCQQLANKLLLLSKERVTKEMIRLLEAPNPLPTLGQMVAYQVLNSLFQNEAFSHLTTLITWESRLNLPTNPIRRLCVLTNTSTLFRLSKAQATYLYHQAVLRQKNLFDPAHYRYFLSLNRQEIIRDAMILKYIQESRQDETLLSNTLATIEELQVPPFPLTGTDLLKGGVTPGPQMGEMLIKCRWWWAENNYMPTVDGCLEWVKNHLKASPLLSP